jgi:glutamine amidotransferase
MQLMATRGREFTVTEGLGWIAGEVTALAPADPGLKIPHMGWNDLSVASSDHPALGQVRSGMHAYFVHSFGLVCDRPAECLATVDYGGPVTAIVGRDNLLGTQFHPEKSQKTGLDLIAGFLAWRP